LLLKASSARSQLMKERLKAIRAARSFEYNRALQPKVEARLEKARSRLKAYLMLEGVISMRLGDYQAELVDGELVLTKLPPDGWEQAELQGLDAVQSRETGAGDAEHLVARTESQLLSER
jgi:hypothetical protein